MGDGVITVTYKPTAADYRRVLVRRQRRVFWILGAFYFVAGSLISIWAVSARSRPIDAGAILPIVAPFVISGIFLGSVIYFRTRVQASNISANLQETTFSFTPAEFIIETPLASTRALWERFKQAVETESDFVLYAHGNVLYPVAKEHFESEEDVQEVRILLRDALGDRARLKT